MAQAQAPAAALAQRVLGMLEREAPQALRRSALRDALRVNNARLGEVLGDLERTGMASRCEGGWRLARRA